MLSIMVTMQNREDLYDIYKDLMDVVGDTKDIWVVFEGLGMKVYFKKDAYDLMDLIAEFICMW